MVVRVFEHLSLEKLLIPDLKEWIESTGFANKYPNFGRVNIGTAHPFAILLFQSVLGRSDSPDTTNLFPSITVADSSGQEDGVVVGHNHFEGIFTDSDKTKLLASDDLMYDVEKVKALSPPVPYEKQIITSNRSIDFNIWGENHDLVSVIYDMVESFAVTNGDLFGTISGRRSGDMNVDFGKPLYGANVNVGMQTTRFVMAIDTSIPYPVTARIKHRESQVETRTRTQAEIDAANRLRSGLQG